MDNIKTKELTDFGDVEVGTVLKSFIEASILNQYSYAVWRYPDEETIHFLVDCSGKEQLVQPEIHVLPPGFLVSPFVNKNNDQTTFIKADLYYKIQEKKFVSGLLIEDKNPKVEKFEAAVLQSLKNPSLSFDHYSSKIEIDSTEKDAFIKLVNLAIDRIEKAEFEKLVPSKAKIIDLPADFDLVECYFKLCKTYSNTMVSLVGTPSLGTWIGASPEVLVSIDQQGIFKTVALAGTQKLPDNSSSAKELISRASWTQKEIEEQALVSRYIINCFKKIRLREYDEKGPKTILAGNVMHLKTEYSVDTKAVSFPELPSVMLTLLHPTSAVSGMPREASYEFLKQNEKYDRQLFSGYIGPVNVGDKSSIFVNIRCMQILDQKAAIYAGAGVTSCSNPEKEWLETELKCETLLSVINQGG